MTEDEMRSMAWNNALHCHGTYTVFSRRLKRLRFLTKLRDFWGFAIPIILGAIAGSDTLSLPENYVHLLKIALAAAALVQILIALWAVFSRWDDGLAYSARAVRDAYEMQRAWEAIGRRQVADIGAEFSSRAKQQDVIDSHDIGQEISAKEKNLGMRSGLIEYQRQCTGCKTSPNSRGLPLFPKTKCPVCGGN